MKFWPGSKISPIGSPFYFTAAIYTAMGKDDGAIKWQQKAYADYELEMFWLKVEPLFNPLRSDPGFHALLMKMGFE